MGCLKIAGRVAGAQDGDLRLHLPGCYKSKAGRARLGCDEMPNDSKEVVEKVLAFLDGRLSEEDIATVAKLMSGEEVDADLPENGITRTGAMATDARPRRYAAVAQDQSSSFNDMFPDASRVQIQTGGYAETLMREDAGRRSASAGSKDFFTRFPDAKRIRHLV